MRSTCFLDSLTIERQDSLISETMSNPIDDGILMKPSRPNNRAFLALQPVHPNIRSFLFTFSTFHFRFAGKTTRRIGIPRFEGLTVTPSRDRAISQCNSKIKQLKANLRYIYVTNLNIAINGTTCSVLLISTRFSSLQSTEDACLCASLTTGSCILNGARSNEQLPTHR